MCLLLQASLREEGSPAASGSPADEGIYKRWLNRVVDVLKRLAGKSAEALHAIIRSIAGATLSFLGKVVGWVAK